MQVTTASITPEPQHKPHVIKEANLLTASGLVGLLVEPGTKLFISAPSTAMPAPRAKDISPVKPSDEEVKEKEPEKPATFNDLWKAAAGSGAGGVVGGGGLTLFKLGHATTKPELYGVFTTYNLTPNAADTMADKVLEVCNSTVGKALFLGVAGGGAAFSVLRVAKPRWSLMRLLIISGIFGLLLFILYVVLARMNVTT